MARQSVATTVVALLLSACTMPLDYEGAFEVPTSAAVLQPETGGPFSEPVGFVANAHGGQIVPLSLRQGRFLTDQRVVSFLRGSQLATGDDRALGDVAVYAPADRNEITLFAADRASGTLLRVPYIVGPDLERAATTANDPDLSGAPNVQVTALSVTAGTTTSERWTLRFEDGAFRARGSHSGLQTDPIPFGEPWQARDGRLQLTLDGTADEGDTITIDTDNGVVPIDVGGTPVALIASPDQSTLAIITKAPGESGVLSWMDPDSEVLTPVDLPDGSDPHRVAWAEDGRLLVADRGRSAAYVVAPGATTAIEFPLPWPVLDVASMDTAVGSLLYVVPLDGRSLWLVDRATGAFRDVNPRAPGDQGMPLVVPAVGIESMFHPYESPEFTDDLVQRRIRSVAIVDQGGHILWAHEDTGCLVQDNLGPRTDEVFAQGFEFADFERNFEDDAVSGPRFEDNEANSRHVIVNACAGLAPAERWTLTYDQPLGVWVVEGDLSGVQESVVFENQRYESDLGEISFLLRSGSQPSIDGWRINLLVADGVAKAIGDFDGEEVRENALRVPGDPVYFFDRVPSEGAGWSETQLDPYILLPGGSTNVVGRVNPQIPPTSPTQQSPEIDITWR